jgi:hexosaminidase
VQRYNSLIQELSKGSILNNVEDKHRIVCKVNVDIKSSECEPNTYPKLGDDESYTITVNDNDTENALIKSNTIWGAIRGIETFSQLIYRDSQSNKTYINVTEIEDWPRFQYRGIMLDTARHFVPINVLLLNLVCFTFAFI